MEAGSGGRGRVAKGLRTAGISLAVLLASVPMTFITTFALTPLWRWIEERFGIESIGHSGPSDWCFLVVWGLWLAVGGTGVYFILRPSPQSPPTA